MADDDASDVTAPDARWLAKLPEHGIFAPSTKPGVKTTAQRDGDTPNCMVVRNADVLVSYGKELRMASLLEVKHQHADVAQRESTPTPTSSSSYKRLTARALDFPIERLLVNPTGKLLAVVGAHKVVIVVLPRTGTFLHHGSKSYKSSHPVEVGVKAALVGAYYHHERIGGRARLADVQWHPWGESGSSLLTMTRDGMLREFDVSLDVEEPVQTVSALSKRAPTNHGQSSRMRSRSARRSRSRSKTPGAASLARARRSTSRIAFDDDSASDEAYFSGDEYEDGVDDSFYTAAGGSIRSMGQGRSAGSFTLGIDMRSQRGGDEDDDAPPCAPDWTPLTLYTLCTNGDLYALCPFMPKRASLPLSYLRSLASYVSLSRPDSVRDSGDTGDLQVRFVSSLLKQASAQRQGLRNNDGNSSRAAQRRAMSATPMSIDADSRAGSVEPGNASMQDEEEDDDELVTVQAPSAAVVPPQPQPQGPFLLAPAPHELSEQRESRGADVFYARVVHADDGLNIVGIASDDGRVDLCVALTPISAEWSAPSAKKKNAVAPSKSGRYALSDSDSDDDNDDDDDDEAVEQLPTLIVYESIDLGILHAIGDDDVDGMEHALRSTPVRFVLDPLYADLVYVHHLAGAHAIGFGTWARRLIDAMQDRTGDAQHTTTLERVLHQGTPSDVACVVNSVPQDNDALTASTRLNPIRDVCIVSDVYLCYSFIALAQSGSLVALELNLRVLDEAQQQQGQGQSYDSDVTQTSPSHNDDARALREATSGQAPPLYASLLGDGPPFAPPEVFKSFQGLPTKARSAVPRSGGGNGDELVVSPETLRTLATTVQTLRGQMRDIVQGGNTVQRRLELQMEELKRQLAKLAQVAKRVQERRGATSMAGRMQRVLETQQTIVRRSDRLLQRLIESHTPELSVYEKRWLAELERLQAELGGGSAAVEDEETTPKPSNGMAARVEALRHRLDLLRPDLEKAAASSTTTTNATSTTGLLGRQQLQQIEKMLEAEAKLLTLDQQKIHQLNAHVQRQLRASASSQSRVRSSVDLY